MEPDRHPDCFFFGTEPDVRRSKWNFGELLEPFVATARSPSPPPEENAMKSITRTVLALALLGVPSLALAQTPAPAPGQSEWAPGHRAKGPGDAKDFAPGQRMHTKDVKSEPGASEYAPGHLPNKDVKK